MKVGIVAGIAPRVRLPAVFCGVAALGLPGARNVVNIGITVECCWKKFTIGGICPFWGKA